MKNLQRYLICFIIGILLYYLVNILYKCNIEKLNIGGPTYVLFNHEGQEVDLYQFGASEEIIADNNKEACNRYRELGIDFDEDGDEYGYMILNQETKKVIDCDTTEYEEDFFSEEEEEATPEEIEGVIWLTEIMEEADEEFFDTYASFEDIDLNHIKEDTTSKYRVPDELPAFLEYVDVDKKIKLNKVAKISGGSYGIVYSYSSNSDDSGEKIAVKVFILKGNWEIDVDIKNEINIIKLFNTLPKDKRCNIVNSRVIELTNKQQIVIMDQMNGTIEDFIKNPIFDDWRNGKKLKEDKVLAIAVDIIFPYLECLHYFNPPLSYVDLKPKNILYKLVKIKGRSHFPQIFLGDLGSIYIQKSITIGSIVEWTNKKTSTSYRCTVIGHNYDKQNIKYKIGIAGFNKGEYHVVSDVKESELTLLKNYNIATYPTPEVKYEKTKHVTSEDVMVWGFGTLLLILLGFNHRIFHAGDMLDFGGTIDEYYSHIKTKIDEFEIKHERLRHIIDQIFQSNREGRSINMKYIGEKFFGK